MRGPTMSNPRWLDRDWAVVRALNEKLLRQGRDRHATPATAAEIDDRAGQELVQVAIESRVDQAKAEQRFEDAYRDLPSEHGFETVGHEQKLAVEPSINRLVPPLFAAKVRLRRTVDALEAFVAREQPGRPASYPASRHKRVVVTAVLGLVLDGGA